jgi:hypothetical protein
VNIQTDTLFLLLIMSQALHSIEEYLSRLWEFLAPARLISGLFSANLAVGFGLANLTIVAFGLWCYLGPVRHDWRSARGIMWFWVLLELGNSIGHTFFAMGVAGYFPGLYTVPALFVCASLLLVRLLHNDNGS